MSVTFRTSLLFGTDIHYGMLEADWLADPVTVFSKAQAMDVLRDEMMPHLEIDAFQALSEQIGASPLCEVGAIFRVRLEQAQVQHKNVRHLEHKGRLTVQIDNQAGQHEFKLFVRTIEPLVLMLEEAKGQGKLSDPECLYALYRALHIGQIGQQQSAAADDLEANEDEDAPTAAMVMVD